MPSKPDINYESWPTKPEAAQLLSVAEKTIDRMTGRGEIQKKSRKRPGLPPVVVFNPADLERILNERAKPFPMPADTALASRQQAAVLSRQSAAAASFLQAISATIREGVAQLKGPHFLTLKEAREESGIPLASVRRLAIKIDGRWRVNRVDLEQFARENRHGLDMSGKVIAACTKPSL